MEISRISKFVGVKKMTNFEEYLVEDTMFNERILGYLESLEGDTPQREDVKITYPLKDGAQIIVESSKKQKGKIEIKAINCPQEVLSKLEKLTKENENKSSLKYGIKTWRKNGGITQKINPPDNNNHNNHSSLIFNMGDQQKSVLMGNPEVTYIETTYFIKNDI